LQERPRVAQILDAAKAGHVPVRLVSSTSHVAPFLLSSYPRSSKRRHPPLDLSEKNPLVELPHDASVIALLAVFSSGTHRGTSVLRNSDLGVFGTHVFPFSPIYVPLSSCQVANWFLRVVPWLDL
jgi:hypothetical protein